MDSSANQADRIAANQIKNLLIVIFYLYFWLCGLHSHCDIFLNIGNYYSRKSWRQCLKIVHLIWKNTKAILDHWLIRCTALLPKRALHHCPVELQVERENQGQKLRKAVPQMISQVFRDNWIILINWPLINENYLIYSASKKEHKSREKIFLSPKLVSKWQWKLWWFIMFFSFLVRFFFHVTDSILFLFCVFFILEMCETIIIILYSYFFA